MPERERARLLVMVTGSTVPEVQVRYGGFDVLFPEHLTRGFAPDRKPDIDVLDIQVHKPGDRFPDLGRYDGVAITGSPARIGDMTPWMVYGVTLLQEILKKEIPLLAVCFGHQMLGKAFNADVGPNPAGYTIGTFDVNLDVDSSDPLLGDLDGKLSVNGSHLDAIRSAGPHLKVIGTADHDACHVVKAGPRTWGVQFHPEFTANIVSAYIRARTELINSHHGPGAATKRLEAVQQTPASMGLLGRFADLCVDWAGY